MRAARLSLVLACLLALGLFLAACGGGSGSAKGGGSIGPAENRPAPPKSAFPSAQGKTLFEVLKTATGGPAEMIVSPAAMVFYKGQNRYPFGVFQRKQKVHKAVNDAEVALYFAKVPKQSASAKAKPGASTKATQAKKALAEPAMGPYPATIESLATKPAFQAKTTVDDPNSANVVYYVNVNFPSNGDWRVAVLIKEGNELHAALLPSAEVGLFSDIPRPGQPAPKIHTPTASEVGGDLAKITTRIPPDTQNQVDFANVVGKEPVLLLFATPQFCQSRVCGPVVDVAEQVKQETGDKAAFIHMEIYNQNNPGKGVRPQVRAYHLPSEPWLFAVNRHGIVSSAVEGAFGLTKMHEVVDKVISE